MNTLFLLAWSSLMVWMIGCSNSSMLSSADFLKKLQSEEAVVASGGYYHLEEEITDGESEDTPSTKVSYPKLNYHQIAVWEESSYGRYELVQNVDVSMNSKQIKMESIKESTRCVSSCKYAKEVLAKINGTAIQKFKRSSSKDLEDVEDSGKKYDKASYVFLFVNALVTETGGYDYTFSKPVPFLLRNDLTIDSYKNRLKKDLSFSYEYTSNNPRDPSGSATTTLSLEDVDGKTVYIKVSTRLNKTGTSNRDIKKDAERYGKFPFPKDVTYTVDTKDRMIKEYTAHTENLISKETNGNQYNQGNTAPTTVFTKLCEYKVSGGKTQSFNCK